jgi:NitT/TauT family transport system substrate-binding protein
MVRDLVRRAGGEPDDVILVDAGARELTSEELAAGAADATFGSYWAWDILLNEHPDRPERVWRVDDELPFSYHSYLLGSRAEFAARQPELVAEFLAVTDRGFRFAADHPVETVEVLRDVTPYFTDDVLTRSLEAISGTWFHDGVWGTIRRDLVEPYALWLAEHRILAAPERWQKAFLDTTAAGAGSTT